MVAIAPDVLVGSRGPVAMGGAHRARTSAMTHSSRTNASLPSVKALVFDVFGTVVDWRTSVAGEVEELARRKGVKVDGAAFADAWRAQYAPSMNRVRTGELPWTTLDRSTGRAWIACCLSSASPG